MVSTAVKRSFNGVARRTSGVKVLEGHPAPLHTNRCRLILNPGTRSRSRVCLILCDCDLDSRTYNDIVRATGEVAMDEEQARERERVLGR